MATPAERAAILGMSAADVERELLLRAGATQYTRFMVAQTYATALVFGPDAIDWHRINAAILARFSKSGLTWIKREAWRMFSPHSVRTQGRRR